MSIHDNKAMRKGKLSISLQNLWRKMGGDGGTPTFLPSALSADLLVAYGATKLVSAYTGPALRVQRASDDVLLDIPFGTKYLKRSVAKSFRGSSKLGVETWYDQVGSNHLTQTTKANQPILATEAEAANGCPAISFDSSPLAGIVEAKNMACATGPVINLPTVTEFLLIAPSFSFNDNYYVCHPPGATTLSLFTSSANVGLRMNSTAPFNSIRVMPRVNMQVLRWRGGPAGKSVAVNGAQGTVATAPAAGTVTGTAFGKHFSTASYDGEFDIIGYACYNRALSDAECLTVEAALYAQSAVYTAKDLLVVFDGDSRTEGSGHTWNQTWVKQLTKTVLNASFINMGVGGQTVANMAAAVASRVAALYDASYTKNIVVFGGAGINDFTANRTALQVQTDFITWATGKNAGQRLIVATCPLRSTSTAPQEAERVAWNVWLRANWATYADYLVDLDAVPEFQAYSLTYWIDIVHFNITGQRLWAPLFKTAIDAVRLL